MNILDAIVGAGDGAAVRQLAAQAGVGEDQALAALGALVPALAAGLQQNAATPHGLDSLTAALSGGRHGQYLQDPSRLADGTTIADGNGILGHVFGSKDVSRQVASRAAATTGMSEGLLKQMLPLVATLVMSAFANQQRSRPTGPGVTPTSFDGSQLLNMLSMTLDQNRDGSMVDDVVGMLGRFTSR